MKKFILNMVIFTIILVTGAFAVDVVLENGLRKARVGEFATWNDIFDSKISSDVIISGNSRAVDDISPEILDSILHVSSYNLGLGAYSFSMQYVRFQLFEKYNQKPKLIIQNVDFGTLVQGKLFDKAQFIPYLYDDLLRNELIKRGANEMELNIPAWQYVSQYRTILRGLNGHINFIPDELSGARHKGYIGRERIWDGTELNNVLSKDSIVAEREPEIVELFDTFLNYCKKNDILIILVFTPQYIKMTDFTKDRETEMQVYRNFSEKYDIPFLDYTNDPICYDTTYFYNAMHLNKKGSELFTLKLANDIQEQNLYKRVNLLERGL
jgi:hypothetical protein